MIAWWVAVIAAVFGVYAGAITVAAFVVGARSEQHPDAWATETLTEIHDLPEATR